MTASDVCWYLLLSTEEWFRLPQNLSDTLVRACDIYHTTDGISYRSTADAAAVRVTRDRVAEHLKGLPDSSYRFYAFAQTGTGDWTRTHSAGSLHSDRWSVRLVPQVHHQGDPR